MTPNSEYPPWEPPFAGTEVEHLLGSLERVRATFRWKADALTTEQLRTRLPSSALTVGGLLKHVAVQEDYASAVKLAGEPMPAAWDGHGWDTDDDWEITSAAADSADQLYALYDDATSRCRSVVRDVIAARGLDGDSAVVLDEGGRASVRRILFDLLEEYARHLGNLDLAREALDGRVGEDPPRDWRP